MSFKTELKLDKDFDINKPPAGAWLQEYGKEIQLGASTKNLSSGIVLLFCVIFMIAGIAESLITVEIDKATIFILFFFSLFTFPIWAILLMLLQGKVTITLTEDKCKIFKGFGILGTNQIIDLNTLSIEKKQLVLGYEWVLKSKGKEILSRRGTFSWLTQERFTYLIKSIQKIMQDKNHFLPEDFSEHLL